MKNRTEIAKISLKKENKDLPIFICSTRTYDENEIITPTKIFVVNFSGTLADMFEQTGLSISIEEKGTFSIWDANADHQKEKQFISVDSQAPVSWIMSNEAGETVTYRLKTLMETAASKKDIKIMPKAFTAASISIKNKPQQLPNHILNLTIDKQKVKKQHAIVLEQYRYREAYKQLIKANIQQAFKIDLKQIYEQNSINRLREAISKIDHPFFSYPINTTPKTPFITMAATILAINNDFQHWSAY